MTKNQAMIVNEADWYYEEYSDPICFRLIKSERRLTFDILFQEESTRYRGEDDGPFWYFKASNGYEVISRSRMDIQTERLWLLGASDDTRSGSMVFSSNEKRDAAFEQFLVALQEWKRVAKSGLWGHPDCGKK